MPTADAPASTDFIRSIVALLRHPQRDPAQLREAMLGSPETARLAFGALLEGRRMAVHPDADRVFRVEGLWGLKVSTRTEQARDSNPHPGSRA